MVDFQESTQTKAPPTVYVVQDTQKDLQTAKQFGELHIILTWKDVRESVEHVVKKLDRKLANIRANDYLLLIGDPLAIGLALYTALEYTGGYINALKWDREKREYFVHIIEPIE